ncbi:MAG TPA: hypothetical protein VNG94_04580, partial [Pyrinomonadaceae bacterium]|nr:hypothetical protein [Pyrinomonadaceae bacterium]
NRIVQEEGCHFRIEAGQVRLMIEPNLIAPSAHGLVAIESAIVTNDLTAPGPPGAVDKGERQARGQKLLLSTTLPATNARFEQRLTIKD